MSICYCKSEGIVAICNPEILECKKCTNDQIIFLECQIEMYKYHLKNSDLCDQTIYEYNNRIKMHEKNYTSFIR